MEIILKNEAKFSTGWNVNGFIVKFILFVEWPSDIYK